jgi:DNA polymerase III subunit beta
MKLVITKDQLSHGLQAVQNVVGTRTTLPILSNILFRADGTKLELTATDLDLSISCEVVATVERPGSFTLPAKRIVGIVRELGAPEVEMEVDDKATCTIRSGSSYFRVNGLPGEEFPPANSFEGSRRIVLPQDKLRSMLKRTSFAVSTDESRYVLNGIFFSLRQSKLTLVATDGRRLALSEEEVDSMGEEVAEFILPTKAINEFSRLLQDKGEVEMLLATNQVCFVLRQEGAGNVVIVSKLVEGNYPNYRQVIPSQTAERIALIREELLHALRRAELMTSEKSNSVKLSFGPNMLSITANTPEVGEARETMALNYKGKEVAVAFNPAYLMDPLKALDTDEVFLELIDELSPGVMKINGPFLYVIMPMRMS